LEEQGGETLEERRRRWKGNIKIYFNVIVLEVKNFSKTI